MKKIINGKMYNTETAKECGYWSSKGSYSDFSYYEETLYRKKTGEFFLFGDGNAASPYSRCYSDGTRTAGEEILPLTFEAAQHWAEEKLSADKYEEIFGEVSEDDSRTALNLSISASTAEKARRAAAKQQLSLSAYIESLIWKEV